MTGYAPNPTSAENAAASLTSGLLARKGQASPAVDAVAHEGVNPSTTQDCVLLAVYMGGVGIPLSEALLS